MVDVVTTVASSAVEAASGYTIDLQGLLLTAAGLMLVGSAGWMIKTVRDINREMAEWRIVLFGIKGDNGINGNVKEIRARLHTIGNSVQQHGFQIEQLQVEVEELHEPHGKQRPRRRDAE